MTSGHELDDPGTLARKPDIGEYQTRKSDMTFWSRYDAVRNASGPTDHWTKMKVRAQDRVGASLPAPGSSFDSQLRSGFIVQPGDYGKLRPARPYSQYREGLKTSFNQRAKDGFQYWTIERPKPTQFGRYGLGSFKTVLGIGNAPRT